MVIPSLFKLEMTFLKWTSSDYVDFFKHRWNIQRLEKIINRLVSADVHTVHMSFQEER